ncbi:MAG TPA: transglycosylase SLT domain-containing protein, partial [Acidimicrobiia bacterium]|nr:transglycosylase SLT domain-containing protein [Acidimicrobiia bacterium]
TPPPYRLREPTMSLMLSLWLLFIGVNQPADLATELRTVVIEQLAGPVDRWRPLVGEYFPPDEIDTAMCIVKQESGGNPKADNPNSSAVGLFQVLQSVWGPYYGVTTADLYDPEVNVLIAGDIWDRYGWGAWSPYRRGVCR